MVLQMAIFHLKIQDLKQTETTLCHFGYMGVNLLFFMWFCCFDLKEGRESPCPAWVSTDLMISRKECQAWGQGTQVKHGPQLGSVLECFCVRLSARNGYSRARDKGRKGVTFFPFSNHIISFPYFTFTFILLTLFWKYFKICF